ncbi:hypothetical protein V8C43DRAFT_299759 [Trichoderma afarasin]
MRSDRPGWLLFLSSSFFPLRLPLFFFFTWGFFRFFSSFAGASISAFLFSRLRQMQRSTHQMLGDERRRCRSTLG